MGTATKITLLFLLVLFGGVALLAADTFVVVWALKEIRDHGPSFWPVFWMLAVLASFGAAARKK